MAGPAQKRRMAFHVERTEYPALWPRRNAQSRYRIAVTPEKHDGSALVDGGSNIVLRPIAVYGYARLTCPTRPLYGLVTDGLIGTR